MDAAHNPDTRDNKTPCVCPIAQYCETHRRDMRKWDGLRWKQCHNEKGYFEAFLREAAKGYYEKPPRTIRVPDAVGDLKRLAVLLKAGCDCDRADRARYVAKTLKAWPKPETLDNGVWAVGVATAPRKVGSPRACLDSLRINGWKPHVFAEPGSVTDDLGEIDLTVNETRLGCWGNFRSMARQLLDSRPDAKLFLLVQDDTVIVPGSRKFLEPRLLNSWPGKGTGGIVSLYTPSHYLKKRAPGCHRVHSKSYWGLCAVVFRRRDLEALLDHPRAKRWKGAPSYKKDPKTGRKVAYQPQREPHQIANVDTVVGQICNDRRQGLFSYVPSLAQHVAPISSIGHGDDRGNREAASVVADWSIFAGEPKINCPSKPGIIRVGAYWNTVAVGGAEVWLKTLLDGLDRFRFDVSGVAVQNRSPNAPTLDFGSIPIVTNPEAVATQSDVMLVWNIEKPERVRRPGVPMIYVSHSQPDQISETNKRLACFTDHRVAVSEQAREGIPESCRSDSHVIRNGIAPIQTIDRDEARKQLGIIPGQIVVAYVGRWADEKNAEAAARAVAALPGAVALYHGYRKGGDKRFRATVDRITGRRAIYRTPDDDLALTYSAADVFVHVPHTEAFGLTYLEAMSAGVPIVAANRGVIAECGERVAVIVEPDATPEQLAAAVREALKGETIDAARRVAEYFSADRMVREWSTLLASVSQNRQSAAA